jgi:hypothetical protein
MHSADRVFYALPLEIWVQIIGLLRLEDYWNFMDALHVPRQRSTAWHRYRFSFHMQHDYSSDSVPPNEWELSDPPKLFKIKEPFWPEVDVHGAYLRAEAFPSHGPVHFVRPILHFWQQEECGISEYFHANWSHGSPREFVKANVCELIIRHTAFANQMSTYPNLERLVLQRLTLGGTWRVPATVKHLHIYHCTIGVLEIPNTLHSCDVRGDGKIQWRIYDAADPTRTSDCATREEAEQWIMPKLRTEGPYDPDRLPEAFYMFPWMPHLPRMDIGTYYYSDIPKSRESRLTRVRGLRSYHGYAINTPHDVLHLFVGEQSWDWTSPSVRNIESNKALGGRLAQVQQCAKYVTSSQRAWLNEVLRRHYKQVIWLTGLA